MGEYSRSRESYYNSNTQNTKMFSLWALHYGTMNRQAGLHTQVHMYEGTLAHTGTSHTHTDKSF